MHPTTGTDSPKYRPRKRIDIHNRITNRLATHRHHRKCARAPCPVCGTATAKVHGYHPRQTFREQVPGLLERHQRRTVRLVRRCSRGVDRPLASVNVVVHRVSQAEGSPVPRTGGRAGRSRRSWRLPSPAPLLVGRWRDRPLRSGGLPRRRSAWTRSGPRRRASC
ncbi:hypothetical protein EKG83_27585 [Saccharothrix syringae]|uniref:Transposase IS204/IS1001/IS1096/IS1165 zinc-finger domain-containing protein n=1 Tax=Saccharothrix syringae TaxID=103733 RepID=A0A5Q0H3Q4_SACSY|nr:hypothetical protein EKG83_27585 [Saccharothrix syringae]